MVLYTLVIALLCLWISGTILLQVPGARQWLQRQDFSLILPEYRFFAPTPANGDLHLLFRDTFSDGTVGGWTEVCTIQPRRLRHALWNPRKRERKALFDAVVQVSSLRPKHPSLLMFTVPYLLILNYVRSLERTTAPATVQFAIVKSNGWVTDQRSEWIVVSGTHRLA